MLRNRLTPEEWEALPESDRGHYAVGKDGDAEVYWLQTDNSSRLEQTLRKERTYRTRAERFLAKFVDLEGVKPEDWDEPVSKRVEALEALEHDLGDLEEGDLEAFRVWKTSGKGEKGDKELRERLTAAEAEARDSGRRVKALEREKADAEEALVKTKGTNSKLAIERDLGAAMDAAKITDPINRKFLRGVVRLERVEVREAGDDLEVVVVKDGVDVPIGEFVTDYAVTPEGRRLVTAADHSGGGDADRTRTGKAPAEIDDSEFANLNPSQQLAAALNEKHGGAGAAAR